MNKTFCLAVMVAFVMGGTTFVTAQENPLLLTNGQVHHTNAYHVYKEYRKVELGEIQYLIHLIKDSDFEVVRNGKKYSSHQAAAYLNFKLSRNHRKIDNAEDFIDQFASISTKTGDALYVIDGEGDQHRTSEVLYSELHQLRTFENAMARNKF